MTYSYKNPKHMTVHLDIDLYIGLYFECSVTEREIAINPDSLEQLVCRAMRPYTYIGEGI